MGTMHRAPTHPSFYEAQRRTPLLRPAITQLARPLLIDISLITNPILKITRRNGTRRDNEPVAKSHACSVIKFVMIETIVVLKALSKNAGSYLVDY